MFLDGVVYASISHNLSTGIGETWKPVYTLTVLNPFYEHPPLAFFIQSVFFRIFGSSTLVEAFYGYFLGLLTLFIVSKISLDFFQSKGMAGFVIIGFSMTPIVSWLYAHNMLEIPLTLFTSIAVYLGIKGMQFTSLTKKLIFTFLSGLLTSASFLVKGPLALFPITSLIAYYFFMEQQKKLKSLIIAYSGLFASLILVCLYIFSTPDAYQNIAQYLKQQVFASLQGHRKSSEHWFVFQKLTTELIVPAALFFIIFLFFRRSSKFNFKEGTKFFLFIAIAASFPIALTNKQSGWYIIPSLPFYILALTSFFVEPLQKLIEWLNRQKYYVLFIVSATLVSMALAAMILDRNSFRRDENYFLDFIDQKLKISEKEQFITVCPDNLIRSWGLVARFIRDYQISLTSETGNKYFLVKNNKNCQIPKDCKFFHPEKSHAYKIYECGNTHLKNQKYGL